MDRSSMLGGEERPAAQAPKVTLATYRDYESAQRAVDHLSDSRFPVDRIEIIGTDLRLVETVLGRLTVVRAALLGVTAGAWFGLLIGLLFGIFAVSGWAIVVLTGVLVGALWGGVFGAVAHALTGGHRDFASHRTLQADRYAITVEAEYADEASRLLAKLPDTTGPTRPRLQAGGGRYESRTERTDE